MRRSSQSQDWSPPLMSRPTGRLCWRSRAGSGALKTATTTYGIVPMTRIVAKCASRIARKSWPRYVLWRASSLNKPLTARAVPINTQPPLSTVSATRIATRRSTGSCHHAASADLSSAIAYNSLASRRTPPDIRHLSSFLHPLRFPSLRFFALHRALSAAPCQPPGARIENDTAVGNRLSACLSTCYPWRCCAKVDG